MSSKKLTASRREARARGEDIIDFGMGNPDMPTPKHIVDKLVETARDPRSNRYSASRGIKGLRKAMAAYYQRRFGVTLDPDTRSDRDARVQGRLRQSRTGDHRARRCGAGAQPGLSDPCVRIHSGGRRDPSCACHVAGGISEPVGDGGAPFRAVADGVGRELSVEPDSAGRGPRFL